MDCIQNSSAHDPATEECSGGSRPSKFECISFPSKFSSRIFFIAFLHKLLFKLQEGANGAHSDDVKRIKEELGNWINLDYKPFNLLDPKTRNGRGLQHDTCGELLTPIQFDWQDLEYDLFLSCYMLYVRFNFVF